MDRKPFEELPQVFQCRADRRNAQQLAFPVPLLLHPRLEGFRLVSVKRPEVGMVGEVLEEVYAVPDGLNGLRIAVFAVQQGFFILLLYRLIFWVVFRHINAPVQV